MKKFASILLAICMCLSVFVMLTACEEEHTHTYKTEWAKDATNHWHACEGEGCTEVADKAAHTWNAGEITTAATKGAAGVKTFTCTVCAQTKTESVAYVAKTTVTADEWTAAFNLGENWTVTASTTNTEEEMAQSIILKRDGNKICYVEAVSDLAGNVLESDEGFAEIAGDVWYDYDYDEDTETYEKDASDDSVAENVTDMVKDFFPDFLTDFTLYEYDEEKKGYVADSIAYGQSGMQVTELLMKFEDGKVVSFLYTIVRGEMVMPYTTTVTYGDAAVTLPTVG